MSVWSFDQLAPMLQAAGMAAAKDEPLEVEALAAELDQSRVSVEMLIDQLNRMGLVFTSDEEPELPPVLTRAGSQYLEMKGEVADEVLHFLPNVIDDLYARKAPPAWRDGAG
jgi:biotin operon repressor